MLSWARLELQVFLYVYIYIYIFVYVYIYICICIYMYIKEWETYRVIELELSDNPKQTEDSTKRRDRRAKERWEGTREERKEEAGKNYVGRRDMRWDGCTSKWQLITELFPATERRTAVWEKLHCTLDVRWTRLYLLSRSRGIHPEGRPGNCGYSNVISNWPLLLIESRSHTYQDV